MGRHERANPGSHRPRRPSAVHLVLTLALSFASACSPDADPDGTNEPDVGGNVSTGGAARVAACAAKASTGCASAEGCCEIQGKAVVVDESRGCRSEEAKDVVAGCALAGSSFQCQFGAAGTCYERLADGMRTLVLTTHVYVHGLDPASGWFQCPGHFGAYDAAMALPVCPKE